VKSLQSAVERDEATITFGHIGMNFDDMFELRMSIPEGTSTNYLKSAGQVAFIHLSTLKEL